MSSPSFYSSAGNFVDTVQGGVDPRTGLFNVSLQLMNLLSGDLAGPQLPLGLSYSPLSQKDEGFGKGFTLHLTRYDIPSRRLVLSTGEEYSISPGGGAVYQKKLINFIFNKTDEDSYQIIYKNGLVERLIKYNSVFVTTLITAPCGRHLSFDWDASDRLVRVRNDDNTVVCQITYASEQVASTTFSVLPNDPSAHYDVLFNYANGYIKNVTLPTDNAPLTWGFEYETYRPDTHNEWVITRVSYPTGAREQVLYDFFGMSFPDAAKLAALPRVVQHTFSPGGEQPPVSTKWEWTKENYLGKNLGRTRWVWDKDPLLDHLSATYRYGSTEKIIASDGINVLSSVMRRYNSYHLLISERVLRDGKLYQRIMDYHAQSDVSFDEQPAQYLLPVSLTEFWDDGTGKPVRSSFTYWKYDSEGNLRREEAPDGTITECVYYPAGGEKGCPPDPHGFTRYLKNMTVTPRRLKGDESATVSVHTWQSLGAGDGVYVVPSRVVETTGNMQTDVNRIYNGSREDRLTFGREKKRVTILTPDIEAGTQFVRRQSFSYEIREGWLLHSETLMTHDGLEATISTLRHPSLGYLLSETDAQGITVNRTYDRLGRVLTRTEAVGTNYERLTLWLYAMEGSGPVTLVTDSAGNQTKTFFDGAGREIRQQRLDKDRTQEWFEVSLQRYNSQGETVFNLSSDWVTEHLERCCISTSISYDGWGNVSEQAFSDDIKNQIVSDPIELTQTSCTKGKTSDQTFSSGTCTAVLDDKSCLPLTETRTNTAGIIQGIRHYEWDGRGFLRQETDENNKKSTWTYDALGRVLTQTLPDGTVISRTYAPHLTENHVTSISVTGKDRAGSTRSWRLGTQVFDGLGRLTKRVSGGRLTSCTYEGASAVPSTVTLPSGKLLKYKYIPELGNVISSLTADGVTQTFSYDTATGQMVKATAGDSEIKNILYPSGSVKAEAFTLNGDTKNTATLRMLNGDVIQYTDISGKETRCERDEFGRILTINDDALSASLKYDALGRLNRQIVTDRVTKSSLTTELEYDDFGQEITRTITDSNGESLKVTQKWRQDGLLAGRITQRDGVEIRKEQYGYDRRNRLRLYRVSGSSFPEDWRGHEMTTQLFEYDALNNLIRVSTYLADASLDMAVYRYENSDDPTQLTSVSYEGSFSQTISLEYDANGCMIKDGAGHTLNYDSLGRLNSVDGYNYSSSYDYDALDRLVSQNINNYPFHFYYRDGQLVSKVQTQWNAVTRLIRNGASCMGMSRGSFQTLIATDQNESVLWSHETSVKEGVLHIWAPYGSGKVTSEQPGFNGERVDPVSCVYHLGNGYRAYNPVLMRFNCPDNLSPFGAGGINPYAYCAGDPVNFTDPTGHISGWGIAGIVLGTLGLIFAVATAGMSIAAAGSIGAAISAASTTALVVGGLSVVADVAAIASGAMEDSNPEVSSVLGWAAVATGLPALGYGVFRGARALSGWWRAARSMPGLARGGAVSTSAAAARTGRALASSSMALGDSFNLFRSAGVRASRLVISAHGEQSIIPLRTFLPAKTRLRFYASDGYGLLTRLHKVAKQSVVARETISGGGLVRNYNLSRVAESYSGVQSLVRRYAIDAVTVNDTARAAFYPADMNMLLRSLQSSNISYETIDAVICRGNWMGLNVPVQHALPA
ncbi:RHS repeat-associated core domain-containing protein [Pantoea agglomerans]|uniref:RHS repeat-associated core domain-containing protein n=1 Tax=Enterobacter agglomerans TaxID=549 RepID=UPI0024132468|nr:RHS repeat-associated core domain-containing protein [Pantoea agglomerans]